MTQLLARERMASGGDWVSATQSLRGAVAMLSIGAAAIHFSVVPEHFAEYWLYGAFFTLLAWSQTLWAAIVLWRPSRSVLLAGATGNTVVLVTYLLSRTTGMPIGPDVWVPEPVGALDVLCTILEVATVVGVLVLCGAVPAVRRITAAKARAIFVSTVVLVIVTTSAVFTPALTSPQALATHGNVHGVWMR